MNEVNSIHLQTVKQTNKVHLNNSEWRFLLFIVPLVVTIKPKRLNKIVKCLSHFGFLRPENVT